MQIDLSVLIAILAFWGIPTASTAFLFRRLEKRLDKSDRRREEKEDAKKLFELLLVKKIDATLALGEATAESVQRLEPEANGKMTKALDYAAKIKHEQKDFLNEQGVANFL